MWKLLMFLFFMLFECIYILISTLTHSGKKLPNQTPSPKVSVHLCLAHVSFSLKLRFILYFLLEDFLWNPPSQRQRFLSKAFHSIWMCDIVNDHWSVQNNRSHASLVWCFGRIHTWGIHGHLCGKSHPPEGDSHTKTTQGLFFHP